MSARAFAGQSVEYATREPRTGRYLASVTSWFYGPKDVGHGRSAGEWQQGEGTALPDGEEGVAGADVVIVPARGAGLVYAGGDPGVFFESRDGGVTWQLNRGLWDHPTRPDWGPGNGGLCLHTIVPWPGDPSRLMVAISAVGVWLSDDSGASWRHSNTGIVPAYVPDDARDNPYQHCVHDVRRAPGRPERLFMQFHDGVYRSDDAGETWLDVGDRHGPPSDFGFPVVVDPADPDSAYVIPLVRCGGPHHAWRRRAGVGDPRRRLDVGPSRRGPAARRRVPDGAARGVRLDEGRPGAGAVLRRDVGRRVRFRRRRRELGGGRRAPAAGVLGANRLTHGAGPGRSGQARPP